MTWYRSHAPLKPRQRTAIQRLLSLAHPVASGCVEHVRPNGRYWQVTVNRKIRKAHRLAWQLFIGPIPRGKLVLHGCDNTHCINTAHLFLGTQTDNMRDMVAKGRSATGVRNRNGRKTHCPQGHPYSELNTWRNGKGDRVCKTCVAKRMRAYHLRRKEEV